MGVESGLGRFPDLKLSLEDKPSEQNAEEGAECSGVRMST